MGQKKKAFAINRYTADLTEESLGYYFNMLSKHAVLTKEEENELVSRIQKEDRNALDSLVCANLRFVVAVAKSFQNQGMSLADLIEEGNIGLIRAAERFDAHKGCKFTTYAMWWIRDAIQTAIRKNCPFIGQSQKLHKLALEVKSYQQQYEQQEGDTAPIEQIAEALGVAEDDVYDALNAEVSIFNYNRTLHEDGDETLIDVIGDSCSESFDDEFDEPSLHDRLETAMHKVLKDREINIVRQFYGFDGNTKNAQELGNELGLSRERVRQILKESLTKLKAVA